MNSERKTELRLTGSLTHEECATVLAALRNWQLTIENSKPKSDTPEDIKASLPDRFSEYWEDGTLPLTCWQIDQLCERINLEYTTTENLAEAALRSIAEIDANENSEPDAMADALKSIQNIVATALEGK